MSQEDNFSRWVNPPTVMPEGGRWLKINKVQYYPPQKPQDIYQPQYQHLSEEAVARKHLQGKGQENQESNENNNKQQQKIADWELVSRATTTKSAEGVDASELVIIIKEKVMPVVGNDDH